MSFYRVKVYLAEDSDIERLIVDEYEQSDCAGLAAVGVGLRSGSDCTHASHAGVSELVNSHRSVE